MSTMHTRFLVALGALLCVAVGPAGARQGERLAISPQIVLSDMQGAYESEPVAERVVVRVTDGFAQTRGEYIFRSGTGRGVRLELGSLHVWCRDDAVVVAHAQQLSRYVRFDPAPGQGALDLLRRSLPPIPSPQAALLLGDEDLSSPTPYTLGVEWVEGRIDGRGVRLLGVGESGVSLEMWVDAETSRLSSLIVNFNDDDGRRLELTVTPIDAGELGPLELNLEGRERETKVSRIVPFPGDSTEGRRMPPMQLSAAESLVGGGGPLRTPIEFADHESGPAGLYVFFRAWGEEASAAMEAAQNIGDRTGDRVIPVFVGELSADASWRDAMLRAAENVGGVEKLYVSLAPELTIERFSTTAAAVIARTDPKGMCTHMETVGAGDAVPSKRSGVISGIMTRMLR